MITGHDFAKNFVEVKSLDIVILDIEEALMQFHIADLINAYILYLHYTYILVPTQDIRHGFVLIGSSQKVIVVGQMSSSQ